VFTISVVAPAAILKIVTAVDSQIARAFCPPSSESVPLPNPAPIGVAGLYAGWRPVRFEIANHAAGGRQKGRETECLWLNY
jgi:hypothetical protein